MAPDAWATTLTCSRARGRACPEENGGGCKTVPGRCLMPEGRGMPDSLSDAPAAGLPAFLCLLFCPSYPHPGRDVFSGLALPGKVLPATALLLRHFLCNVKGPPFVKGGPFLPGIKKGPRHLATAPGIHTVAGRLRQERTRRCSSVLRSGPWDGHRPGTDRERGYLPPGNRSCGSATRWLFHA